GRISFFSGNVHDPAKSLDDRIERFRRTLAGIAAETRNRAIDDARICVSNEVVPQAQAAQSSGAEILAEEIRVSRQIRQDLTGERVFQVECHSQLVSQTVESRDGEIIVSIADELGSAFTQIGSIV